jgi:hypothetical protein
MRDPIDERARWEALGHWFQSQDIPVGEATVCMLELVSGYIATKAKNEADVVRLVALFCESLGQVSIDAYRKHHGK